MNTKPTKAPKQAAILSEDVHTDLDGIEVGSHVRWEGISLFEEGDGGLTTRSVRLFPIWDGNLAVVPLSLDPMPHADSALVPEGITTRRQFWEHVHEQLVHLLADQRAWVRRFLVYQCLAPFNLCHSILPLPSLVSGVEFPNIFRSRTLPTPRP